MDGDVEKVDVSRGCDYMKSHTFNQLNGLKSLKNYSYRDDMEMNYNLHYGYVSIGIDLINRHTLPHFNKSSHLNGMNWGIKNGYVSGGRFYMNSHTVSEANNHNSIDYTKKSVSI